VKIFEVLKKQKLTILVGLTALLVGLGAGAGAMGLAVGKSEASAKPTPSAMPTQTIEPEPTPDPAEDFYKQDISGSEAEAYPDLPRLADDPTLPAGSLDPVSDPAFPVATNKLELQFFKKAKASCDAFMAKGAKIYHFDGSYELWAKDAKGDMKANFFDAGGAFTETLPDFGHLPSICAPSSVNEQRLQGNNLYASQYWLESLDGVEFIWHSHNGGPGVSSVQMYFTGGLISSAFEGVSQSAWIRYGLNSLETKSALKVY
jgi:hypothetical protein